LQACTRVDLPDYKMTQVKKFARYPVFASTVFLIALVSALPARAQTIVCLETTLGDICMELLESEAPVTAQNFLTYLQQGSYRESFFHISEPESPAYLQAGRFVDTGTGGNSALLEIFKRAPITNESSVSNLRGTVAAVPDDPTNPDSTTSQFLINLTDNTSFDTANGGYTVFARLIGNSLEDVADIMSAFPAITLGLEGLTRVPVIDVLSPAVDSPRFIIFDAYVFDGDLDDFLNNNGGSDGGDGGTDGGTNSGTDGGTDGGTDEGDGGATDPGDGTLYEDAVCVDTNVGEFCMALFPDRAPATVQNFLNYVTSNRYDSTIVHRSVPNFVIQAGGYTAEPLGAGIQKDPVVQNEFGLSNLRATVAMARIGGQVNSATSEWFVNLVNNSQLDFVDGGFTVFAEVITGMSVVDAISNLPRTNQQNFLGNAFGELPVTDQDNDGLDADDLVLINRVYVTDVIVSDIDNGTGSDGDGDSGVTTTATYQPLSQSFTMPVYVGDSLYRFIMRQAPNDVLTFSVDTSSIVALTDVGQETATMDLDAGTLVVPSISVKGKVFNDVTFDMTVYETLTFRLSGFTRATE